MKNEKLEFTNMDYRNLAKSVMGSILLSDDESEIFRLNKLFDKIIEMQGELLCGVKHG